MKKTILALIAALTLSLPAVSSAQQALVEGEVTKIDEAQGKITMRHGPIKNLDMDAMTMVFRVGDPGMLKQVKVGDKVKFEASRVNGQITVTKMQKGK